MKLTTLKCPNCSGNIQLDHASDTCFCPYCGAQISIDDETIRVEITYKDEAKIRELEYEEAERKRLRDEFAERSRRRAVAERTIKRNKIKFWIFLCVFYFVLFLAIYILSVFQLRRFADLLYFIASLGTIVFPFFHPWSPKDRLRFKHPWFIGFFSIGFFLLFCLAIFAFFISGQ